MEKLQYKEQELKEEDIMVKIVRDRKRLIKAGKWQGGNEYVFQLLLRGTK
jgi:hypothetical protein